MHRILLACALICLWHGIARASVAITPTRLTSLEQRSLQATARGEVDVLESLLAPGFVAVIQVPSGPDGETRTLRLGRTEFLLYALQVASMARDYRMTASEPPRYRITPDLLTATSTRTLNERLTWNGRPLAYTSRRITHYGAGADGILITGLEVEILDWQDR